MPSIAEATGARRRRERRRLAAGVGLVLVGTVLVGLGAAGAVRAGSLRTGATAGGFASWTGLLVLALVNSLDDDERGVVAVGSAVGLAGLLGFWAFSPANVISGPALLAGLGYLLGLSAVLATVLAAASVRADDRRPARTSAGPSTPVTWTRSAGRDDGGAAADGGATDDDDIDFPLERD